MKSLHVVLPFNVPSDFIDTGNMDDEGLKKDSLCAFISSA
jgi:hypothetical protein